MSGNEFACSLGSSSAKIVWVWKKLVEKRWRITHADIRPGVYGPLVFGSFNCNDFGSHLTKTHQSQQIRILHKTNKKYIFFVNCWPSGKHVNLLYMSSILVRGSFCFNYCLNSGAWRWSVCGTAEVYGSPGFFDSGLQLICIFWSLVSHFPSLDSLWGSGLVSLLASQAHQHHGHLTNLLLVLLAVWAGAKSCWKMKSASLKSWSAEGSMKCSKMYW